MSRIIILVNIWLVECSPSLKIDLRVFPYLKGFDINKDLKFIYFSLVISGYICFIIYLQVRSITESQLCIWCGWS